MGPDRASVGAKVLQTAMLAVLVWEGGIVRLAGMGRAPRVAGRGGVNRQRRSARVRIEVFDELTCALVLDPAEAEANSDDYAD